MLSNKYGHAFDKTFRKIAKIIPFSPNSLSITGFLITLFACYRLSFDLLTGGVLILVGALFDMLDGAVARTKNKMTRFGAFLDSVLDRYSDAFIFLAIAYNLWRVSNITGVILCLGTLLGSFMISYSRARAEGIGEECKLWHYGKAGKDNSHISWSNFWFYYPGIMGSCRAYKLHCYAKNLLCLECHK